MIACCQFLSRVRVLNFLEHRGVIESRHELTLLDDDFAEREPALAQLASAAVSGRLPAGPELRQRQPVDIRDSKAHHLAKSRCDLPQKLTVAIL